MASKSDEKLKSDIPPRCVQTKSSKGVGKIVLTPQQLAAIKEHKWAEFDAKQAELRGGNPSAEQRDFAVIDELHRYMEEAEWFAEHTPHPFRVSYWPTLVLLAGISCRYLRELARLGNEHAIHELINQTVEFTESLDELVSGGSASNKRTIELAQYAAESLPYWPMLQFCNTAANNHFPLIAEKLRLGQKCYLNVSEKANYSLQTPINRFVWKCLRHFQEMHRIIASPLSKKGNLRDQLAPYVYCQRPSRISGRMGTVGMIFQEEIPIYERSFKLAPPTKANAATWADIAIMPYVKIRFPDLREVPELKSINTGASGKRYAPVRKAVIQSLQQITPRS